jgi:hypothetical protein
LIEHKHGPAFHKLWYASRKIQMYTQIFKYNCWKCTPIYTIEKKSSMWLSFSSLFNNWVYLL